MTQDRVQVTEEERRYVEKTFPLLAEIKDGGMREKVARVWVRVWKQSGYRDLEEAPNRHSGEGDSLVTHTNVVTRSAWAAAQEMAKGYGLAIKEDVLLAASLLHDVDKLVLYERKDGHVQHSQLGQQIPHGAYGGWIALEEGLPLEVVNVIITHSRDSNWQDTSVEGVLVHNFDHAIFEAVGMALGLRSLHWPPLRQR